MDKDVFRLTLNRVEEIEKTHGSLENFVKETTKVDEEHTLKIKENSSIYKEMSRVYQELSDLELADLMDYRNLFGRFDGDDY